MQGSKFIAGTLGFLVGVLLCSFVSVPLLVALGLVVAASLFTFVRFYVSEQYAVSPPVIIFLVMCGFGVVRYDTFNQKPDEDLLSHAESRIGLVGTIVREPDEREKNTLVTLGDISLGIAGDGDLVSGRILIRAPRYPHLLYGDRVAVSGILKVPEPFETDGGRQFDYPAYLAKDGIHFVMNSPRIERIGVGQGSAILATLIEFKQSFLSRIRRFIPAPEEGLLAGIIFGEQGGINKTLSDDFRKSGLVHVVVLSGYNLSVVADWIMKAVAFLPRIAGLSLGAFGIVVYTLMAGASATAVRASLMALLVILAQGTRRKYDVTRALIIAGLMMVCANPKVLVFDRSFQLSFLATIAVIYVAPLFEKKFSLIPEKYGFRGIIATTIATQVIVLPYLLYTSGTLSLLSLPANILVLPLVPATMFVGFLTGVLGFISSVIAVPIALLATSFLSWIIGVAEYVASLPLSGIVIPAFPFAWCVAVYVMMAIVIVRARGKGMGFRVEADSRVEAIGQ
jgi:competence protein ComEC